MLPKKVPTPTIFDDLKKSQQTISLVQKQLADLSVIKNKPLKTGKFEAKILETHHLQDAEDQNKKTAEALNELRKTAFQRDSKKMAPVRMLSGNAMMHSRIAKPSIDKNKEQYEKLCAVMRNMIETMGHLQSFVLELEKLSETRLRKMYSDLSKQ
ncbi:MAG TPA: hypothetical protein VHM20_05670, partial [Gammaproteobacteria bacterium]|nr:hypothetical protein [Gammaproteobacteria bacterium]